MKTDDIKKQAMILAKENRKSEPGIRSVYWFPNEHEIRLVELEDNCVPALSGHVEPFYFGPAPEEGLVAPSGIAVIRTDEFRSLDLPEDWGPWDSAVELEVDE